MSSIHSLTRRLEKLEVTTRAKTAPPSHVVIFYDADRPDKDAWLQAETARVLEAGGDRIKTLIYMPEKETLEDNAARYGHAYIPD